MCPLPIYLSHDGNGKLCIQLKEIEAEQHILLLDNLQFQKLLMSDLEGYAPTWDKNGKTRKARGIFAIYYEGPNSKIEKRDWVLRMYPLFLNAAKRITE